MDLYEMGKHQADFDVPAMPDSKVPSVIKDHNSVLFKAVARTIANRWKALDSSKKVKYEQLAAAEMVKYKTRMDEYRTHMINNSEITKRSEKLMKQSIRTLSAPSDLINASEGSDTTPGGNMSVTGPSSVKLPSRSFLDAFGTLAPGGTGGLGNSLLSMGTIPLPSSLNGSPGLGTQVFGGSAFSNATSASSGVGAGTVQPQQEQEQQQQHQRLQLEQHFRTLEQLQMQHHRQEQQRRQQELQQQQHLIRVHPFGSSAPDQGAIEQQLQRMRYAALQQQEQDWQRMPGGFDRPAEAGGSPMHTGNNTSISSSNNNNNTLSPSYESLRQQLAGPYQPPVGDVMRQARQQEEQLLRQQQQRLLQNQQALQQHQATTVDNILRAQQAHRQQGLPPALAAARTTAIDVMRAQRQQQTTAMDVMRAQQQQQQNPQAQMKVWQPQLQEQALEVQQREVLLLLQAQQQEEAAQHRKASLMESIELELKQQQQQQQGGATTSPMPPPSLPSLVRGATP
jgi:hypothetical protein